MKEIFTLFIINLKTKFINLREYTQVVFQYYHNFLFLKTDITLLLLYFFKNPFIISREFLTRQQAEDVYTYGETPLTTLEKIALECQINSQDVVFELGCGRGRTCFWLSVFIGCEVVGVEFVPDFVEKAQKIKERFQVKNVRFLNENLFETDLSEATVVYLYGSCFSDQEIRQLIQLFSKLRKGTKIITVSYALTDYHPSAPFEVQQIFPAQFTWGLADVYLQIKKS